MRIDAISFVAALSCIASACGGSQGTIGAILGQQTDGTLTIREAPEDLASYRAGLRPGDQILLVDGRDVRPLPPERLHALLAGEPGTRVKLTVIRGDDVIRVTLRRRPAPTTHPRRPPD